MIGRVSPSPVDASSRAAATPVPELRRSLTGPAEHLAACIRRVPGPLASLLLVGALLSIAWDVSLPAFQGPDERGHFAYVQHLAETGSIPRSTGGGKSDSTEAEAALTWLNLKALTGDLRAAPAWSAADLRLWRLLEAALPHGSRSNGAGPNPLAKNPPLYYAVMSVPYRLLIWLPLLKRLFLLRLANALLYLTTIALVWLLAGEVLGPTRWKQTLAAGVVALQPQLSFMSAVINPDNMLVAVTTAVLLTAVRLVKLGPSLGRVLAVSVLTAAAVLTHGRGLVTVPVLVVALLASAIRHRIALRAALTRSAAAVATVAAAVLAYVAFGRASGTSGLYGGQASELNSGRGFNLGQFFSTTYQFYLPKLTELHRRIGPSYGYRQVFIDTFYGAFGSLEVAFKARIYDTLQVLSAVGLLGLYTAIVVRWRRLWGSWPVVVVLLALVITNLVFLHYVSYRSLLASGGTEPLIVGRYLLPMVSLFGLAIAFTVGALPRRIGPAVGAAILATGVLLSLAGVGITVVSFYA
jgi:4-amino-4-deoxy-L-arabinose transferase-like glycosyltransferase